VPGDNAVGDFQRLLAAVKSALAGAPAPLSHHHEATAGALESAAPDRGDLVSRLAHELELVRGGAIEAASTADAADKIAALARRTGVRSAAVGDGVTVDLGAIAAALEQGGIEVVPLSRADGDGPRAIRDRIARCDLGVAEACHAIASSGTLAVVSDARNPGSLTLLPPLSVIVVRAARIVADLAALLDAIGPAGVAANRLTLITGPSRTADIEKRIVLGAHGPRELCAIVIRSADG